MKNQIIAFVVLVVASACSLADEISLFIVSGQSNARQMYAYGVECGLRAGGDWENVRVYHAYRSGNWMFQWVDGVEGEYTAAQNFTEDLWAPDGSSGLQMEIQKLEDEGHTVTIEGMFWFQGEGDTGGGLHRREYQPRLTWMLNQLWDHYGDFDVVLTKIDWNHDLLDDLLAIGRTPEDIEEVRAALQATADDLGLGIMDSRDRKRIDVWHIADRDDPRGNYAVVMDLGADEARLMIERNSCEGDLNGDGVLDVFDVFKYLEIFNAGCP
jgi:hypothetical protein